MSYEDALHLTFLWRSDNLDFTLISVCLKIKDSSKPCINTSSALGCHDSHETNVMNLIC